MKIGILTFQWVTNQNFGASLQSYACKELLNKILNIKNSKIIDFDPTQLSMKRKILSFFTAKNFREYNNKFLNLTKKIQNMDDLKKLNNELDIFVVGSDQVWRPIWFGEKSLHYFFDFVDDNKKKVAYAASFGVDYWEGTTELTEKIKPLIKRVDYISVREKSGIDICKNTFDVEAEWVLDPTLMLKRVDYQPILDDWKNKDHLENKYTAYMLLDDNKDLQNFGRKISKKLNSQMNFIKGKSFKILGRDITFYNKVSQWLTYLKDSELVITDSFHCTVFSLIFHKNFIVVANKGRGMARLESLLSMVGLEERFIRDINDCDIEKIINKTINYNEVDEKIEKEREKSFKFLKKALYEEV